MQEKNQQIHVRTVGNNVKQQESNTGPVTNQVKEKNSQNEQGSKSVNLDDFKYDQISNQNSKGHPRRRRLRKRKVHHPPEYYEQLKMVKLNQARVQIVNQYKQTQWNGRFAYDTIPQTYGTSKRGKKSQNKANSRTADQKVRTKEEKFSLIAKPPKFLPQIDKTHKNVSKSFQIRNKIKNSSNNKKQQSFVDNTISQQQSNIGQIKGKRIQQNESTIKYTKQVEQLYQKSQKNLFPNFYKELLIDISYRSQTKIVKKFLDEQLKKIRNKQAQIFQAMRFIEMRQSTIQKLKKQFSGQGINKISQKQSQQYRQVTLRCIEQILKWRQQTQNILRNAHIKNRKTIIYYSEQNYLLAIGKGLPFLQSEQIAVKKDPFLLSFIQNQDKSRLLKIRACELLLLQEQLRISI